MRCFYTNANSLLGKFEEFKCRVSAYDIVGVVETWASSKICDAELAMEGFCMHRKDRTDMPGGGLVLYVKDSLQSTEVDSFGDIDFEESVWCRLSTVKDSLLVGLCYRSPSSPTTNDDRLLELLEAAVNDKKSSMILIMGDFNYRNIDYVSHMVMSVTIQTKADSLIRLMICSWCSMLPKQQDSGKGREHLFWTISSPMKTIL